MLSRVAHCEMLRADSSVCGSSRTTSDGRTEWPSARLNFMPRMRPVMPATLMMAPEALLPGIVGKHDLPGRPADVRALALVELAAAAIGDAVEALDRIDDLRVVFQQQVVAVQFRLDALQHVHRVPLVAADQAHEFTMAVEDGPNAGTFADARFAAATRHGHRE